MVEIDVFGNILNKEVEEIPINPDLSDMAILILSCDINQDLFEPFHHCMEKYWPDHPRIIYSTETVTNPYYETICKNYPLSSWTVRIRETLQEIPESKILAIVDDYFIRKPVDVERVAYANYYLKGDIAVMNFEKSFDPTDKKTPIKGFKRRLHGAPYEVSIMCGLWQKDKLIKVLDRDCDPWTIETQPDNKGFTYYINSGDFIIDGGYRTWHYSGIRRGKWCREVVPFFEKEGINIDFNIRGFDD